ncbi:MAG: immunoglobulin-like domain-containing protein, partial [Minisyncoccia bacterium]
LGVGNNTVSGTVAQFENSTGSCYVNPNNSFTGCTSDERLKTNITPLSPELENVLALNPVTFTWKSDGANATVHTGFIAQEVQQLFPDLVMQGADGYYALNYAGLTPYLTRAIQQLNDRFLVPTDATSTPTALLAGDGKSIDLYKLATYTLSGIEGLSARMDAQDVRVTALETRIEALESGAVSSASGSPITLSTTSLASALSSFGVLVEKGIAQFNTLVFRQLVASKDADGTSSAGSVTLLTGNTVAQVNNSLVQPSTKVFVTFNSQIEGSWWVSDKVAGSFRVVLSAPQTTDVSFDYFLVQTEGQIATSTPDVVQGVSQSSGPDTVAPVITLLGDNPLHISVGGTFAEPGVTVVDAVDGTDPYLTFINGIEQVASEATIDTSSPTTYLITYQATDAAGNLATAMRSVIVGNPDGTVVAEPEPEPTPVSTDTLAPVVTLIGDAALQIIVGDTFTDSGATATDDTDGDLTTSIAVTGAVDTAVEGLYTLTYSATDAALNTGASSRVVTVLATSTPAL